jgi:hypothetical protein
MGIELNKSYPLQTLYFYLRTFEIPSYNCITHTTPSIRFVFTLAIRSEILS